MISTSLCSMFQVSMEEFSDEETLGTQTLSSLLVLLMNRFLTTVKQPNQRVLQKQC